MATSDQGLAGTTILVVGAGIMGAGIAQVAAQAGHAVKLFDLRDGAAAAAKAQLAVNLQALAAKGKVDAEQVERTLSLIEAVGTLGAAADAGLVIEAIVERLDAKRALFRELESIVASSCVLATNTSSISVTAIANGLSHPRRVVGMHFFNPVPLMKLVEVISGLHTDAAVAAAIFDLCKTWGKVAVHAKSTPGFIVNRVARPYYAEALALLQEQATTPAVLDACLRAAGFRMGPCELMDLIGHDTNFAVTQSVFEANFFDRRYTPSLLQRELVEAGWLGRKTGRGFYLYPSTAQTAQERPIDAATPSAEVTVHGQCTIAAQLADAAQAWAASRGVRIARQAQGGWTGLSVGSARLVLTDGRRAGEISAALSLPDVAVFDRPPRPTLPNASPLAYAVAEGASAAWQAQAPAWLAALGFAPQRVADTPALLVARTLAMLINEACDAVQQGVCTTQGVDAAMKLGVNYPAGPFEWLAAWGAADVLRILDALDAGYRGERYRVSPRLRHGGDIRPDPGLHS